jgi:hypothetical protein
MFWGEIKDEEMAMLKALLTEAACRIYESAGRPTRETGAFYHHLGMVTAAEIVRGIARNSDEIRKILRSAK